MKEKMKKQIMEALDERYNMYVSFGERKEDWLYYKGMLKLVEQIGFSWERLEDGKHFVY